MLKVKIVTGSSARGVEDQIANWLDIWNKESGRWRINVLHTNLAAVDHPGGPEVIYSLFYEEEEIKSQQ